MKWILLVWMAGGHNMDTPSQMSAQFETMESCKSAYKSYVQIVMDEKNFVHRPRSMRGICVPNK